MKDENVLLCPPTVVTIILTGPGLILAGVIQVIVVALTTLKDVAFNPPSVTALAPVKSVPLIVTVVPPFIVPDNGKILLITGGLM